MNRRLTVITEFTPHFSFIVYLDYVRLPVYDIKIIDCETSEECETEFYRRYGKTCEITKSENYCRITIYGDFELRNGVLRAI